ncbi:MAG: F0F1 ATP synthase subunit B [candidate division Zixibacteria bacterium]|nr:F0F1 ATP synthase subunit B [candidate division Zixibacteria bacterium]
MNLEFGQIITQAIAFVLVVLILRKFAWKPLLLVLEQRKEKIQSEFDQIEAHKHKVQTLTEEYQEKLKGIEAQARTRIQEAVNEGRKISQEIQAEARTQSKEILSKAQGDVEREVAKAKQQLKNDIVNLVISATEKIVQEKLDQEKHKKLIADFVEEAEFK